MIRLLDETTVGQIAAGEVVERPLSVVKELVENSLDAGATRIAVTVARGGLESIEVADDGAGISQAELALAFARHATSKLTRAEDLERIASLGFRGEGLASIAAVARVRLISRRAAEDVAHAVDAHAGIVGPAEPVAAPPGTRVVVRELFGNVPVRREYVRTPAAEFARISSFLATLALGYPEVTFSLAHDGRATFVFPASALEQRLAHVFGTTESRALLALGEARGAGSLVEARSAGSLGEAQSFARSLGRVHGYISTPGVDRSDRRLQLLFVNGRLLRSTQLAGAWSAGYATYALANRQPFGVLFLEIPAEHVDPNVHPTKSDVRFRRPEAVHDLVRRAIRATLGAQAGERLREAVSFAPSLGLNGGSTLSASGRSGAVVFDFNRATEDVGREPAGEVAAAGAAASLAVAPERLKILAQLDETFVLATDGRALVLVDQHAAHERVAFEAIVERAERGASVNEPLLLPYTIELGPDEAERFERSRATLAAGGLEAEPFGERSYRIIATPAGYGARAFDLRGFIADLGEDVPGLDARERVWASLACHSVTRAGERLEHAEMTALLARLARCANPMHCPHGRPTIVRIEAEAIARLFKRA
jgi:DNA mismatch repair protein MutL